MWFSSVLRWLQGTGKASPRVRPVPGPRRRPRPPAVEELEQCLTPSEVGANDFRLPFLGNDGIRNFGAFDAAVAYNGRNHEYLVVWTGDDFTDEEFAIFGQRIDAATGALLGGKIRLSDRGRGGKTGPWWTTSARPSGSAPRRGTAGPAADRGRGLSAEGGGPGEYDRRRRGAARRAETLPRFSRPASPPAARRQRRRRAGPGRAGPRPRQALAEGLRRRHPRPPAAEPRLTVNPHPFQNRRPQETGP
jgi:hypothetical protein